MSSRLENTSAILGEYMLKGWTLTDLHCDTCNITPLMREPHAQASREGRAPIQFCALCDGGPLATNSSSPGSAPSASEPLLGPGYAYPHGINSLSTPFLSSPLRPDGPDEVIPHGNFSDSDDEYPDDGGDTADQISRFLLQGYALLNENCPQPSCRGIPLVGYPRRKDGGKDGRKMCVSCGTRWVGEGSMDGMTPVSQPAAGPSAQVSSAAANGGESPRSRKRRELYELGTMMRDFATQPASARAGGAEATPKAKEKARVVDLDEVLQDLDVPAGQDNSTSLTSSLEHTTASLASTLDRLADSLTAHTANKAKADESRYFVDVKLHTEAMRDVLSVLGLVDKLRK